MLRSAVAAVLALAAGALAVFTAAVYIFATFCWEYCEPEDAPTVWDGVKFALPFGIAAIGLMTGAVRVHPRGRGVPWPRALAIGVGLCIAAVLLLWAILGLFG